MFIACFALISQLRNILEKYVYVGSEQEVFDYTFLPTAPYQLKCICGAYKHDFQKQKWLYLHIACFS